MLTPLLSLFDPLTEAEGSLDPLGLASVADQLADSILPGLTARMWHPRFLTAIAVASVVTEQFDRWATDGSPPYLVFEWLVLEAYAQADENREMGWTRVPGIDKARAALRAKEHLSARCYLKTPTVFGFHGVYKRLAKELAIADLDLGLGKNGRALLRIWEREEKLSGFLDGETGEASKLRRLLIRLVGEGLRQGHTVENWRWRFFRDNLSPVKPRAAERRLLWQLLCVPDGNSATRGELFRLMAKPSVRTAYETRNEKHFFRGLQDRASNQLRYRLRAIDAYEDACRVLQDGFDWLRWLSTHSTRKPITAADFVREGNSLAKRLSPAIKRAQLRLDGLGVEQDFDSLIEGFESVSDAGSFFDCLLERHEQVQRDKPPAPKRSWFERGDRGGVVVRLPYRLIEPPDKTNEFVHSYRTANVASFVDDLGAGQ